MISNIVAKFFIHTVLIQHTDGSRNSFRKVLWTQSQSSQISYPPTHTHTFSLTQQIRFSFHVTVFLKVFQPSQILIAPLNLWGMTSPKDCLIKGTFCFCPYIQNPTTCVWQRFFSQQLALAFLCDPSLLVTGQWLGSHLGISPLFSTLRCLALPDKWYIYRHTYIRT